MDQLSKAQCMAVNNSAITDNLSLQASALGRSASMQATSGTISCFNYWQEQYYPAVIRTSYPVYIQERALDKGKQAFEIIKVLKDKKLVNMSKVGDFIDLMDELIKIL